MTVRLRFSSKSTRKVQAAVEPETAPAVIEPPADKDPNIVTGKDMASGLASLLSPFAALCAIIALWRLGQDMGFAGNFFIDEGPLSHWQVWFAAAGCLLAASTWLNRRGSGDDDSPATS